MTTLNTARNDEIRAAMLLGLDFVPTDAEIEEALVDEPHIEHQAKWWGWHDFEVRDLLASELERVHEWADELEYQRVAEQERAELLERPRWRRWLSRWWSR